MGLRKCVLELHHDLDVSPALKFFRSLLSLYSLLYTIIVLYFLCFEL